MSHAIIQLLPQTLHLCGTRYEFVIEATATIDECWFEFRATHRASERSSVINTVNTLMLELLRDDQDANDARWVDTRGESRPANVRALFRPPSRF